MLEQRRRTRFIFPQMFGYLTGQPTNTSFPYTDVYKFHFLVWSGAFSAIIYSHWERVKDCDVWCLISVVHLRHAYYRKFNGLWWSANRQLSINLSNPEWRALLSQAPGSISLQPPRLTFTHLMVLSSCKMFILERKKSSGKQETILQINSD